VRRSRQRSRLEAGVLSVMQEYQGNDSSLFEAAHGMESTMEQAGNSHRMWDYGKSSELALEGCSLAIRNYLGLLALCSPWLLNRYWTWTHASGFVDLRMLRRMTTM
jgi:hypothetical protein